MDSTRPERDPPGPERRQGDRRINTLNLVDKPLQGRHNEWQSYRTEGRPCTPFLRPWSWRSRSCSQSHWSWNHDQSVAATANARFDCAQWHEGATVLRRFIETDAQLRRKQTDLAKNVRL